MDWFRNRRNRGRPRHPDVLTPAEWRVLEHVREGATNAEIAVRLGVSINTVRYHVSSMLAKLDLADRHALAAWDGEPREASRAALGRTASGRSGLAAPFIWLRDAGAGRIAAGISVVAVSVAAVMVMSQLQGAGEPRLATPEATLPAATPTTEASERVEPTGGPGDLLMPFEGVSIAPGPLSTPTREVSIGNRPPSPFEPRNEGSADLILYDLESHSERNLGPGVLAGFNPDGQWLAWWVYEAAPPRGDLYVMNLESTEIQSMGVVGSATWLDSDHLMVSESGRPSPDGGWPDDFALVDVHTGEMGEPGSFDRAQLRPTVGETEQLRLEDHTPQEDGPPPWTRQYRLHYLDGSRDPIEFEAVRAVLAPDGTVVLAVPPPDLEEPRVDEVAKTWEPPQGTIEIGNVYAADPWSMQAEYLVTVPMSYGAGQWPFDASEQHVFWTVDFCRVEGESASYLYHRETHDLVKLDDGFWAAFTRDGDLSVGASFARRWMLDVDTLDYTLSLPEGGMISWSPDYRYAVSLPGAGGMCP